MTPVTALLALMAAYPAGFDGEQLRPLKLGIHQDLRAAGFGETEVKSVEIKRALARYGNRPRYRKTLREGVDRVDLHGRPATTVRADLAAWNARKAGLPVPPRPRDATPFRNDAHPPNATPIPKENLVPGRLELTAKFSERPRPLPVQGGLKIGVQTDEGIVTAILPPQVWRKLEQAAQDYPQWVAALSGSLERFADGEIALKHPALQGFEKKARPEAEPARAVEAAPPPPTPVATPAPAPTPKPPEAKATEAKAPAVPASNPNILRATLSLKGPRKP